MQVLKSLFSPTNKSIVRPSTVINTTVMINQCLNVANKSKYDQSVFRENLSMLRSPGNVEFKECVKRNLQRMKKQFVFFNENTNFQQLLAMIRKSIIDPDGILYHYINIWVVLFEFQVKKIKQNKQKDIVCEIKQLFKKQFELLTVYIVDICKLIFKDGFVYLVKKQSINNQTDKFEQVICMFITQCHQMKKVHDIILKDVVIFETQYSDKEIQQDENQLLSYLKLDIAFNPFFKSRNILHQFCQEYSFNKKIELIKKLQRQLLQETVELLREERQLSIQQSVPILSYIMKKCNKQFSGSFQYLNMIIQMDLFKIKGQDIDKIKIDQKKYNKFKRDKIKLYLEENHPKITLFYQYLLNSSHIKFNSQ